MEGMGAGDGKNLWDERGQAYRDSTPHASGADLDLLVAWAGAGEGKTALDVGSGGGHLARRLTGAGFAVTTSDPSPGMWPDVICKAEDLPFAGGSYDLVASRLASHHFSDLPAALIEMARATRGPVLIADLIFVDERVEEAETLRDPSHVAAHSLEQWRELFAEAGITFEAAEQIERTISFSAWLERCGCEGADAERARELVSHRLSGDGYASSLIVLKGAVG